MRFCVPPSKIWFQGDHIATLAFISQILDSPFLIYLSVSFPLSSTFLPTGCKHARPKHHLLCFSDGSVETMYCHDLLRCATTFFRLLFTNVCKKDFISCFSVFRQDYICVWLFCVLLSETREKHLEETRARVCGRINGGRCEGSQRTSCNVTKATRRT